MELVDNKIYTIDDIAVAQRSSHKTIEREISRGNLPKPVRVAGKKSWLGKILREHIENLHTKASRK